MPCSIVVRPVMLAILAASPLVLSPVSAAADSVTRTEQSDIRAGTSRISLSLNPGFSLNPPYLLAQASVPQPRSRPLDLSPPSAPAGLEDLKQRDTELEKLRGEQRRTLENEAKLKREIEQIGDDRRKFNQQIIATAARVAAVEERIEQTQQRLQPLEDSEQGLRASLQQRHNAIGEVLAALQRIGRHAPPALLVPAEDALQSVRSAMLLGAIVPEMRQQAEMLAADLAELVRLRKEIADERDKLARDLFVLADERQRLSAFVEERQKRQAEAEKVLTDERQRAQQLARQAETLKDLINQIEQNLDSAGRSARMAARGTEERKALDIRPDLAALRDPGRISPAIAFASAKGMLPLPVKGARIKEFGAADGLGGTEKGLSIAARAGLQITAPCDGWVVYAGSFRNYGQLLILNVGGGYHVLLAGMERISVDLGQFVVTGEPVAVMGSGSSPFVLAGGSSQPVLYVEFRKDGVPVDPSPWWATTEVQKVRG